MNIISKRVFIPSPGSGVGAMGAAYYCKKSGSELISYLTHISRSDTADVCYIKRSLDNGRTWEDSITWDMDFAHPDGTGRRHPRGGYVDPVTGRYILIWTEGVLPTDDPLEGLKQWTLHYAVSENGDRSRLIEGQIIHDGADFSPAKHMPGIELGKNAMMIGDLGCRPITRSDGVIVVPVQVSPAGEDGYYTNPGDGYTYTDAMMLFGTWNPDGSLRWTCSERIIGDPNRTTRGMVEPTIAKLDEGKILCVMRGSNDARPELPGYRWYSLSSDGGETWSVPEPWRYSGNTAVQPFHSPSSMSQLIELSDGRVFWI
ncbi:MAG: exo-alpha-sialidase [Spirochaetales bacterium]|nr:exo-alpha-sialidase [Spirochaetales bacterium]